MTFTEVVFNKISEKICSTRFDSNISQDEYCIYFEDSTSPKHPKTNPKTNMFLFNKTLN